MNTAGPKLPWPRFDRRFFESDESFSVIGSGEPGGKAHGLAFIRDILRQRFDPKAYPGVTLDVPRLTVLTTDTFDRFIHENRLPIDELADAPDARIAHAFERADLSPLVVGDLRGLIAGVTMPLAVRSSSLLEDALEHPFAGVYATKMIPNNQPDADTRFRRLIEAIKFVYASTFFSAAREYRTAAGHALANEKMAVMIQEVVGRRHAERFYPDISGVARSWNFYPSGRSRPEEGVVSLALGLGKTIVDGGRAWTYSPAHPGVSPPAASARQLMQQTQSRFWAVNMGIPAAYDPMAETEYLLLCDLDDAEKDQTLGRTASTYDAGADRLVMGTGRVGPRALTFAPLLELHDFPLNRLVRDLLGWCEEAVGGAVEIEFAVMLDPTEPSRGRLGFLQVRPMFITEEVVDVPPELAATPSAVIASESVLGNGEVTDIEDIVYVVPHAFDTRWSRQIALELGAINGDLVAAQRRYALIGFGRWGSEDPWLGIPVGWGQIAGARVMVEAGVEGLEAEPSQGSHFLHNLAAARVSYFWVPRGGRYRIDWRWIESLPVVRETQWVRHVRVSPPLTVKVDGRCGRGVVLRAS
jgi:hypothetical protein